MATKTFMVKRNIPPGPKGKPVLGSLLDFMHDPLEFLTMCAGYGDVVRFRIANLSAYLVNNPEYIEDVLVTNNRNYVKGKAQQQLRSVIGDSLVVSSGNFWLRQRRLMQPAFHREKLIEYTKVMSEYTEQMLLYWQEGQIYDIHHEMMRLTLDVVCKCLFGSDVDSEARNAGAAIEVFLKHFISRVGQIQLPESIPTSSNRRFRRAVSTVDAIIYRIIEQRRHDPSQQADLLSILLHSQDEDGSRMNDQQLRDEVVTLFIAGHETTANIMSWIWYLLASYPEVEMKLRNELQTMLGGRIPTFDDLVSLRYTDKVIKEALRLYPPAWVISREAVHDCNIGPYYTPAGTQIFISQYLVQHDPRYFDEPERFNPDRWDSEEIKHLPKYAYFPFGGGPRFCIGSSFAQVEATLILATVAQQFRVTLLPGKQVELLPSAALRPKHGIKVVLVKV